MNLMMVSIMIDLVMMVLIFRVMRDVWMSMLLVLLMMLSRLVWWLRVRVCLMMKSMFGFGSVMSSVDVMVNVSRWESGIMC